MWKGIPLRASKEEANIFFSSVCKVRNIDLILDPSLRVPKAVGKQSLDVYLSLLSLMALGVSGWDKRYCLKSFRCLLWFGTRRFDITELVSALLRAHHAHDPIIPVTSRYLLRSLGYTLVAFQLVWDGQLRDGQFCQEDGVLSNTNLKPCFHAFMLGLLNRFRHLQSVPAFSTFVYAIVVKSAPRHLPGTRRGEGLGRRLPCVSSGSISPGLTDQSAVSAAAMNSSDSMAVKP
ncbi:hypothetical protein RHMOL_Rhmol03G0125700 [Rhododendron molle]|uniref:Uncharacterized protein n=3 Tax=Rhododendron molle TaxID=49168 RepID=A0ACC0PD77_RHOML|nr:hypothetical protein RHMOL_Rhmol03G0125700 [Rhododendron molle]KAI8563650.1 hypothetical protein RHMOL_Rhmol03G0125700 [Rhododendron molle]KAI8563653.1 hypothetical protein RHMOL_Rhmol03G0125700 [Rhododendron molle]